MINQALLKTIAIVTLGLLSAAATAQSVTHFGQPFQRHVTLTLRFDAATQCSSGRAFFERFPAGDIASSEYVIPGGNILVITDFAWEAIPSPASFASNAVLQATLISRFGNQAFRVAHVTSGVNLTPDFASMNRVAGQSLIASGIRVGTGRYLCASAQSKTVNFTAFHIVANAEINGYLIPK